MKAYLTTTWYRRMTKKNLTEGIQHDDLNSLVDSIVSIDEYKSKIGDDNNIVVLAIRIKESDPAKDLSQFIETGHNCMDVDISPGPDAEGYYTVFVEINRDRKLWWKVKHILADVQRVDNAVTGWKFTCYDSEKVLDLDEAIFKAHIIDDSYKYTIAHDPNAKAIAERIEFLKNY